MGWKISSIIIHQPTQIENEKLLNRLGFENITRIEDAQFEFAKNPDYHNIYIGTYKDNLLICIADIPALFFDHNKNPFEKLLNLIFPNSEICSIVLQSSLNFWGYFVSKNKQRIRIKAGSADDGTFIDYGEPLNEEMELLSKSTLDASGQRTYLFDDLDDEPMTEDQVGEDLVFAVSKRYFGNELNRAEELLFETTFKGYRYSI